MAIRGPTNRLSRKAFDYSKGFEDGTLGKLPKAAIDQKTKFDIWDSSKTGGKAPYGSNFQHIGGQIGAKAKDAVQYIKQHDPSNSSNPIKDQLNIMQKLQSATDSSDLMTSIQPLQTILGSQLYGAAKSSGSKSKANQKAQNESDIIKELIEAALSNVGKNNPEKAEEAAEKINQLEIDLIKEAFYKNSKYNSNQQVPEFVSEVNHLIPLFRSKEGIQ